MNFRCACIEMLMAVVPVLPAGVCLGLTRRRAGPSTLGGDEGTVRADYLGKLAVNGRVRVPCRTPQAGTSSAARARREADGSCC